MTSGESTLQKAVRYLYLFMLSHLAIVLNFMIGCGLFFSLTGWMVVFDIFAQVKDTTDVIRLKEISLLKNKTWLYGRRFYKVSLAWSLALLALGFSFMYFMTSGQWWAFGCALLSLISIAVLAMTGLIFAYLVVHFPNHSIKDWGQNALAYTLVKARELILLSGCLIGLLFALAKIHLAVLFLLGFGIIGMTYHIGFTYLIKEQVSLFSKHADWRY
ncbi:hypothetical protein [Vaginisenegalia massiliensis]|uniref:hypothetical protein n=1 Tax=Vaginisenegalia massiliensis TaxID=2058294 RepID=UPI000F53E25F|nr:hypothetical protein [Vaginisenegalia massiliensis]